MTKKDQVKFDEKPQVIPETDDVTSSESSGSECDDPSHHHDASHNHSQPSISHFSKNEKKARKALVKLGIKPIPGITRVTLVRSKNIVFAIKNPEVYKNPTSNSYIVFGEAKVEDNGLAAQAQAARKLKEQESFLQQAAASISPQGSSDAVSKDIDTAEDDDVIPDESGMDSKDIQMVMDQCKVSRNKAVKALRDNDGDIVNAIMELTS